AARLAGSGDAGGADATGTAATGGGAATTTVGGRLRATSSQTIAAPWISSRAATRTRHGETGGRAAPAPAGGVR
ncbi:MAG: hypothetical protein JO290_05655, partial [Sphingomonadaceae bacterium]|nr:hypothetical protein [Sphingomonadaceae bacterium]